MMRKEFEKMSFWGKHVRLFGTLTSKNYKNSHNFVYVAPIFLKFGHNILRILDIILNTLDPNPPLENIWKRLL